MIHSLLTTKGKEVFSGDILPGDFEKDNQCVKRVLLKRLIDESRKGIIHWDGFANLDLDHADLRGLNMADLNLRFVSFIGARLHRCNLNGSDLTTARFLDAVGVIDCGIPWGYRLLALNFADKGVRISAGCRWFTIDQARRHWGPRHKRHAYAIPALDMIVMRALSLGWIIRGAEEHTLHHPANSNCASERTNHER